MNMASGDNTGMRRRADAWPQRLSKRVVWNLVHGNGATCHPQILVVLVVNVTALLMGMTFGFSGVALPEIRKDENFHNISAQEESWIASFPVLSFPMGSLVGAGAVEYFGRKTTILGSSIPFLLGWTLIAVGQNLEMLYSGRFFTGISVGMSAGTQQVYVAEISETYLRGILGSSVPVGVAFGTFLIYLFSTVCTWRQLATVAACISGLQLILTWFIPETPVWLIGAGKHQKAKTAMKRLRGPAYDVETELSELLQHHRQQPEGEKNVGRGVALRDTIEKLLQPQIVKPFFILVVLFFTQVYCGVPALIFYLTDIFVNTGTRVNATAAILLTGAVRVLLTALTPVLLWKSDNRKLLIYTGWAMTVPLILLGTFHFLAQEHLYPQLDQEAYTKWIPTACILVFFIFNTPGFGTLPWVLLAELFPSRLRGLLSAIITFICSLLMFSLIKGYPFLVMATGNFGVFWFFGMVSFTGTVFVMLVLPDTKDMTLDQIEEHFSKGGAKPVANNPRNESRPARVSITSG